MSFISKNIVYFVISILSIFFILILLSQQRTYFCLNNLEAIKNKIEYLIDYVNGYAFSIIIKVEMPKDYEYIISSDGTNVYIQDLSCNMKLKIERNVSLIGEIYSKNYFYIIKNGTHLYISPKEIDVFPESKILIMK